jgi:LPXTG-site transpeptidase (sortase) family protein
MNKSRKSGSFATVFVIIGFGAAIGIGYLLYDSFNASTGIFAVPTLPSLLPTPTVTPVVTATETLNTTTTLIPTTLYIPSAGIYASVVEVFLDGTSWDIRNLGINVGHLQGTAWLESPGNIVLSGHVEMADGRQGVFATIDELEEGDLLVLQHGDEERQYTVRSGFRVQPDDLSVLYPTQTDQLTLITCDSYDFFQNAYLERIVVVADRLQ